MVGVITRTPRGAAGFDKDIDLDLGHVAEEAVFVLAGDGADALLGDKAEEGAHAWPFVNLLGAAHAGVASMRMMRSAGQPWRCRSAARNSRGIP